MWPKLKQVFSGPVYENIIAGDMASEIEPWLTLILPVGRDKLIYTVAGNASTAVYLDTDGNIVAMVEAGRGESLTYAGFNEYEQIVVLDEEFSADRSETESVSGLYSFSARGGLKSVSSKLDRKALERAKAAISRE